MSAYENKLVKTKEFLYNWFKEKYGEPSFPKFVDMIIEVAAKCGEDSCSSMDVHWRPYYAACSYCDLPYNFISKVFAFHNAFKPLLTLYLHLDGDGGAGHGGAVHGHAGGGAA